MGQCSVLQPSRSVEGNIHCRVESECEVRSREIIVHRLRNADHLDAQRCKLRGYTQRIVPADRDDSIQTQGRDVGNSLLDKSGVLEWVGPRRPQDGATTVDDLVDADQVKGLCLTRQQSLPAFNDTDTLVSVVDRSEHRTAYRRVEPGTIPTARQDSDFHL